MSLNIDKCMVLTVMLNHGLALVNSVKYLGVIIDSKLSFNEHIDTTCKKANSS